ncbi:MAG: aminoglycoside phosphotransferase family protein [Lachnospiraceae bacterium]|nr:aminoglycoside phosphotransferase family protein [Lachnospiraceae bacterium]
MEQKKLYAIASHFIFDGEVVECVPFGNGHINDTYRLTCRRTGEEKQEPQGQGARKQGIPEQSTAQKHYILQKLNRNVFPRPEEVMENVSGVTEWLKKKILENGGDVSRETLNLVHTHDGSICYVDPEGEYWRAYLFIENATTYDLVEKDEDFYQSAVVFGNFQRLLADYPASTLHETIENFHNTPDRFRKFEAALEMDACGRAAGIPEELRFVRERRDLTHVLSDKLDAGLLPLRVTHNDTKLNNIMIDNETGKAICVIDLDTVMPGLSLYDFGDSIRFGASTAAEDERDLEKVSCSLHLYEIYVKGFIEGCGGALTDAELDLLPMGAILMTFECGIRFLTDYLEGDHYFKIHREGQNLDRARTQFCLVADMEKKLPQMKEIVNRYR